MCIRDRLSPEYPTRLHYTDVRQYPVSRRNRTSDDLISILSNARAVVQRWIPQLLCSGISPTYSVAVTVVRNRSYGGFGACHDNAVRCCILYHLHIHKATHARKRSRLCFVLPCFVARNDDIHDPGIARAPRTLHVTAYTRFYSGE